MSVTRGVGDAAPPMRASTVSALASVHATHADANGSRLTGHGFQPTASSLRHHDIFTPEEELERGGSGFD